MSERLERCPECGQFQYAENIIKEHNPETTQMNMNVTLRCTNSTCDNEWEGLTASPYHLQQRRRGLSI